MIKNAIFQKEKTLIIKDKLKKVKKKSLTIN